MNDFRELFTRQRQAELRGIPSFPATLASAQLQARSRVARRGLWLYGTASAAAVVLVAALSWSSLRRTPDIQWSEPLGVQLSAVTWDSPTDFLLETPDAEALQGKPRLLQMRDLTPVPPAPAIDTND